jgi:hypothetical protein
VKTKYNNKPMVNNEELASTHGQQKVAIRSYQQVLLLRRTVGVVWIYRWDRRSNLAAIWAVCGLWPEFNRLCRHNDTSSTLQFNISVVLEISWVLI